MQSAFESDSMKLYKGMNRKVFKPDPKCSEAGNVSI